MLLGSNIIHTPYEPEAYGTRNFGFASPGVIRHSNIFFIHTHKYQYFINVFFLHSLIESARLKNMFKNLFEFIYIYIITTPFFFLHKLSNMISKTTYMSLLPEIF